MTPGAQYIQAVFERFSSEQGRAQASYNGAFLTAALAIMSEVESPLKEEALVKLALLELEHKQKTPLSRRHVA